MLWQHLRRFSRKRLIQANIQKSKFDDLPFQHSWANLVKMYDLRMFYIANAPSHERALTYTTEVERLHNELNYLTVKSMGNRLLVLTILFYGFYAFYDVGMQNWQDYAEPKHELNLYNELDEGGDEGDDD